MDAEEGMRKRRRIMVITGTPGVGKHAVAGAISDAPGQGWSVTDTSGAARRAGLYDGNYDEDGDTTDIDTGALARAIRSETEALRNHIVVGHLAPYAVPRDDVVLAVVLRRDPYDLMNVYSDRGYAERKARENAGAEMLGVIEHDTFAASYVRTTQFDTTNREAAEVADAILEVLAAIYPRGDYCQDPGPIPEEYDMRQGSIDWMGMMAGRAGRSRGRSRSRSRHTAGSAAAQSRILGEIIPGWPRGQDAEDRQA